MENTQIPYDIIQLPSDGLLYPNGQKSVKVEYLTAMDESILTSSNLASQGLTFDVLLERKIKNIDLHPLDLLRGDRMAILIWLRSTGYGSEYPIRVYSPKEDDIVNLVFDLTNLKTKPIGATPNEQGEFEMILPVSKKKIKFKLMTGRDEKEISRKDEEWMKRGNESDRGRFILEQQILEIDGERDIVKLLQEIAKLPLKDSIEFKKYSTSIEPGIDFSITVETPVGESIDTFLNIRPDFFLL
jgi:hypothetical protein